MIPAGKHDEHLAELVRLRREVAAVRALHFPTRDGNWCVECTSHSEMFPFAYPCDTIRALDAPPTTTDEEATNDGN